MKNTPSKNPLQSSIKGSFRTFCEREAAEKSGGNHLRLSAKSQEQKMTEVIWGIWSHWQKLDQFWKSQKERRFGKFPYKVIQLPTLQPSTVSNTQRNHTAKCHSSYQPLGGLNIHWFVDRGKITPKVTRPPLVKTWKIIECQRLRSSRYLAERFSRCFAPTLAIQFSIQSGDIDWFIWIKKRSGWSLLWLVTGSLLEDDIHGNCYVHSKSLQTILLLRVGARYLWGYLTQVRSPN